MYNFYIHHSPQAVKKKKYLKNDERNCEELSCGRSKGRQQTWRRRWGSNSRSIPARAVFSELSAAPLPRLAGGNRVPLETPGPPPSWPMRPLAPLPTSLEVSIARSFGWWDTVFAFSLSGESHTYEMNYYSCLFVSFCFSLRFFGLSVVTSSPHLSIFYHNFQVNLLPLPPHPKCNTTWKRTLKRRKKNPWKTKSDLWMH